MYKKPYIAKVEKGFHFILFIYRKKLIKNGIKICHLFYVLPLNNNMS